MYAVQLDFENKQPLVSNLLELKRNLISLGLPAIDPATVSVEAFAKASVSDQTRILSNLSTYIKILSQSFDPEIQKDPRSHEIARLKWALECLGMRVRRGDVYDVVSPDQVIEIYNLAGIQLYRNMLFFKMCSYNLLDLSVNSWAELFDKPKTVIDATFGVIASLQASGGEPVEYGIPPFLQKEKFDYANSLKTLKVTPKHMVPLYDKVTGQLAAAISTYQGEVVAEGMQSSRYNII